LANLKNYKPRHISRMAIFTILWLWNYNLKLFRNPS